MPRTSSNGRQLSPEPAAVLALRPRITAVQGRRAHGELSRLSEGNDRCDGTHLVLVVLHVASLDTVLVACLLPRGGAHLAVVVLVLDLVVAHGRAALGAVVVRALNMQWRA